VTQTAHILVVEDEPLSRDVLVRMLRSRPFKVDTVNDGPAALEWLEHQLPDLILLDVSMPGMSGLDVLNCIRQKHNHDKLPVILVTAMTDAVDIVSGFEAGANDYVVKPVNMPILLARIGVALNIKRGVERLVQAERHRVMMEALEGTCDQLAEPMAAVIVHLESLRAEFRSDDVAVGPKLDEILNWAHRVGDLIDKFKKLAAYQTVPYTAGIGGFVEASLASARKGAEEGPGEP